MVKSGKNLKKTQFQTNLKLVEKKEVLTKPYNDIDLNNWKNYSHVLTNTLWEFESREKSNGHSYDYHGNYIPQIANQLFERFTKKNDIVLDLFFGSGTSGIEALNMTRRCIGVELKEDLVDYVSQKFNKKEYKTTCLNKGANFYMEKTDNWQKTLMELCQYTQEN